MFSLKLTPCPGTSVTSFWLSIIRGFSIRNLVEGLAIIILVAMLGWLRLHVGLAELYKTTSLGEV